MFANKNLFYIYIFNIYTFYRRLINKQKHHAVNMKHNAPTTLVILLTTIISKHANIKNNTT